MKLFEQTHSCLMDILYKKTPFKLAVENTCTKHTIFREDRKNLTNIIGCSLRHFYVFDNLISQVSKDFNDAQKAGLYLFLSNNLFVPVISAEELSSSLEKLQIKESDINKLKELSSDKTKLIPKKIDNDSIEYLHYRFNVPLWVLKMWMKHFKGYTYKIVKSINRPANHYAIVNSSLLKKEEVANYPELQATQFDGLYLYNGNVAPKRHSLFKDGKLVTISPAEYYLLSKLDLDVIRKIGFYSETFNELHLQLMAMLSPNYHMDIIAGTAEAYYQAKKDLEKYHLNGVNLYDTGHTSIITCLSDKVSNFFVAPKNTDFAEFRKSPDYFNRIDSNVLDGYIANQKAALISASDFVEDGGNLIYLVTTMNKKETVQIVDDFLKEKADFTLVEQKQFLPFDKYDSTLFIAIFKKEVAND